MKSIRYMRGSFVKFLVVAVLLIAAASVRLLTVRAATTATPIKHVVIIYQENHSWDEVMSQFCQAHPDRDCTAPTIGDTVTLHDGTAVTISAEPDVVPIVKHQPDSQALAASNDWDQINGCTAASNYACITAIPASSVGNLYAAADSGAIATNVFQPTDHASWAAHFELIAADDDGFEGYNPTTAPGQKGSGGGCRQAVVALWQDPTTGAESNQPACIPDYHVSPTKFPAGWPSNAGGAFEQTAVKHIPNLWQNRLDPAGIGWKEYISGPSTNNTIWNICADFAACIYSNDANKVVASSQLTTDATKGQLPAVSIVLPDGPTGTTSQHNGTSMTQGDNQIGAYLSALSKGPQWSSTAVFVLYDDCGCFYDHVTPPSPELGPRTPFVLSSPWAVHGSNFNTITTTASLLSFIEHNWLLKPLSNQDGSADSLFGMFDFNQTPDTSPLPMQQRPIPTTSTNYLQAHPSSDIKDNT